MHFWNAFPFVRFSLALITGILWHEYTPSLLPYPQVLLIALFGLLILAIIWSEKYGFSRARVLNGWIGLSFFVVFGYGITALHYGTTPSHHYSHTKGYISGFAGTVVSPASERDRYFRYELSLTEAVVSGQHASTTGTLYLYIRKDTLPQPLFHYGDQLLIKGSFFRIPPPGNPHEFDYQRYMERQGIYSQSFVSAQEVKKVGIDKPHWLLAIAYQLREYGLGVIDRRMTSEREKSIAKALLMGVKDHLDNDIKKAYSSAGAMHVLAVSGLHVGIVYLIVRLLFGKIKTAFRNGKYVFTFLAVSIIWAYALVTGLSPSVLRAATMFSVIALGEMSNRKSNIYNSLGIAAFILLVFDPYLLFSVGFQLSFAAVLGIVYLQPKMYRLFSFQNTLINQAWAITCVSLAAQLATFPLSAYYFHQFPTYFLVSNLLVIPSAFLFLIIGLVLILLDFLLPFAGSALGWVLSQLMWFVNECISSLSNLPSSLIEWIYFDQVIVWLIYGWILSLLTGLHFRSFKTLLLSCGVLMALHAYFIMINEARLEQQEITFYEVKDNIVIDHVDGINVHSFMRHEPTPSLAAFTIDPHRLALGLPSFENTKSASTIIDLSGAITPLLIGEQRVLLVDTTTFHLTFKNPMNPSILYIENEAIKNLKWAQQTLGSNTIILGSGNSKKYREKMRIEAEKADIKLHSLMDDGAYSIAFIE